MRKIKPSTPLEPVKTPAAAIHSPVAISFKYVVRPGHDFCLSTFSERDDGKEVCDCLRQLTTMTWQQVLQTGGKGPNKAGLGYTPYEDNVLRKVTRPLGLDPSIRIAGVRASSRVRVFGAYHQHIFYVLWFDQAHAIVPA